ncbi:hypothetical protein HU761_26435 [Pseudomonas sp. SWRI59]|uniref:hypothetical protein n=1 Tax=unclassified Pseudomonas TaxID=196821 RepID=UPI001646A1E1|nr:MULTISPECIES: hypothetical protein [unclassified Pseudomonas]MBC3504919.1 hypothetical protein [Pseudomonas sp. SWRI59]MBC3509375.1 hypothetical protein [Pseudomonas sp. SWRI68]
MHLTWLDDLLAYSPAGPLNIGGDVPAADIPFGKRLFVHTLNSLSSRPGRPNPAMLIVLDRCKCTAFGIGLVVDLVSVAQGIGENGIAVFSCRVI